VTTQMSNICSDQWRRSQWHGTSSVLYKFIVNKEPSIHLHQNVSSITTGMKILDLDGLALVEV